MKQPETKQWTNEPGNFTELREWSNRKIGSASPLVWGLSFKVDSFTLEVSTPLGMCLAQIGDYITKDENGNLTISAIAPMKQPEQKELKKLIAEKAAQIVNGNRCRSMPCCSLEQVKELFGEWTTAETFEDAPEIDAAVEIFERKIKELQEQNEKLTKIIKDWLAYGDSRIARDNALQALQSTTNTDSIE